jgi:hypothetical protein
MSETTTQAGESAVSEPPAEAISETQPAEPPTQAPAAPGVKADDTAETEDAMESAAPAESTPEPQQSQSGIPLDELGVSEEAEKAIEALTRDLSGSEAAPPAPVGGQGQ